MKILMFLLMAFSMTALGNVSAALKQRLTLHKDFAEFGQALAGESLASLLQTKAIDVLLKELGEKIAAAEAVDLTEVDNQLRHDLLDWLSTQENILGQLNADIGRLTRVGEPAYYRNKHGESLYDQIEAIQSGLITKFVPASINFTTLPLIQQEIILKESYNTETEYFIADGTNSDKLASQFYKNLRELILFSRSSFDYKMKKLRTLDKLLNVDLQEAMPQTTTLPAEVFASSYTRRKNNSPIPPYAAQGAADVVIAGFPHVVEGLKQLSLQDIERLLTTVLKDNNVKAYNNNSLTSKKLSSLNAIRKSVVHDLTLGGANFLTHLTVYGYTKEKYLKLFAHEIKKMQAAKQ